MQTTTFDDGSTLTWNDDYSSIWSTDSTDNFNRPSASWAPQGANPAATSWDEVLKYGLARTIDAKTRPQVQSNTLPYYQTGYGGGGGGGFPIMLLLIIGVAIAALA